jgi:hypothetical protein
LQNYFLQPFAVGQKFALGHNPLGVKIKPGRTGRVE